MQEAGGSRSGGDEEEEVVEMLLKNECNCCDLHPLLLNVLLKIGHTWIPQCDMVIR